MASRSSTRTSTRRPARSRALPLFTRHQVAKAFDKDPRTIAKWLEDGLPIARRGRGGRASLFRLPDCIRWVFARELETMTAEREGLSPQVERALLDRRRREELELKMQVRRGELVEVLSVQAEFAEVASHVKVRLRAIPDAIADQVAAAAAAGPASVKALLLMKIDDALRELARGAGGQMDDEAEAEREAAAAAPLEPHEVTV